MNASDHILFIGLGNWDLHQLELAKAAGYRVIVTNRDAGAAGLNAADVPIVADGRDVPAILAKIMRHRLDDRIAYVYTGTELFTTAAVLAATLGVPWHSPRAASVCENKDLMRHRFAEEGVFHPKGGTAKTVTELRQQPDVAELERFIIKPVDSLSSKGVSIVEGSHDLATAAGLALDASAAGVIVWEEYIDGTLHDVNGILTEDACIPLGVNDKVAGPLPFTVVVEGSAPTVLTGPEQIALYALFEKACRAAGLGPGPVKGDFIRSVRGDLYVLEVAPRLHGPLGSIHLIPNALGIDPFKELLNYVMGNDVQRHSVDKPALAKARFLATDDPESVQETSSMVLSMNGKLKRNEWKSNNDVNFYIINIDKI